jgi:hypothetical protein
MPDSSEIETQAENPALPIRAFDDPVIARCVDAGTRAYHKTFAKTNNAYEANKAAHLAYRSAIPPLTSTKNIGHFIACVAHGMLIGTIEKHDATRFLDAAQVASGAICRTPTQTQSSAR